jgi:CheY-like chemotaxis protein
MAMMPDTESLRSFPTQRALPTVAVVSRHANQHVLDTILKTGNYTVVLIESPARAYAHIRRLAPQMVVVCLEIDDLEGVQALSMLNVDSATSHIPVVTYLTSPEADRIEDDESEPDDDAVRPFIAFSMN